MHRFSVLKQNYAQVLAARLRNPCPAADPAIGLDQFGLRFPDDALNPLIPDVLTIRALSDMREVLRESHKRSIPNPLGRVESRRDMAAGLPTGDSRLAGGVQRRR